MIPRPLIMLSILLLAAPVFAEESWIPHSNRTTELRHEIDVRTDRLHRSRQYAVKATSAYRDAGRGSDRELVRARYHLAVATVLAERWHLWRTKRELTELRIEAVEAHLAGLEKRLSESVENVTVRGKGPGQGVVRPDYGSIAGDILREFREDAAFAETTGLQPHFQRELRRLEALRDKIVRQAELGLAGDGPGLYHPDEPSFLRNLVTDAREKLKALRLRTVMLDVAIAANREVARRLLDILRHVEVVEAAG